MPELMPVSKGPLRMESEYLNRWEILRGTMSQENEELSRQMLAAFNQRDIGAFFGYFDPDVEFIALITRMEGGDPYRGHGGMQTWWDTITETFPDFAVEILDSRADGHATVAQLRLRGHGAGSSAPIDQTAWSVMKWRNRKITWLGVFPSEAEALEAAGLSE